MDFRGVKPFTVEELKGQVAGIVNQTIWEIRSENTPGEFDNHSH